MVFFKSNFGWNPLDPENAHWESEGALYSACTALIQCLYSACTVLVQCLYSACTVLVQCLYSACTVLVQCLYSACTVFGSTGTIPRQLYREFATHQPSLYLWGVGWRDLIRCSGRQSILCIHNSIRSNLPLNLRSTGHHTEGSYEADCKTRTIVPTL